MCPVFPLRTQFSSQSGWTSGSAQNTAHTADLSFNYRISNIGTDYASSLTNLIFNIYIGNDPNPAITCQMNNPPSDRNCNLVSLNNIFPGDVHEYVTGRVWLSFDKMKAIDLGAPLYVVVDSYSLGNDDVIFQNAKQGGVTVQMDDGVSKGYESTDTYILPTWTGDTIFDVLGRYFPITHDAYGNLLSIQTPNFTTNPPTWAERPLSDSSWFDLYTSNLGSGSIPFKDTLAQQNSTLLMRYQNSSSQDGYSDRSKLRVLCGGQSPCPAINDPTIHPQPNLIAGLNTLRVANRAVSRLAFLNTGNYDAYGVEAIMYAPDSSVSIGDNTIGGGGRVKASSQVVLGNRINAPGLGNWRYSTAKPYSSGTYSGTTDTVYTITAQGTGTVGGTQPITFNWTDGRNAGTIVLPAGYQSPLPIAVTQGVQVGFYSGLIVAGDSLSIGAQLARDTFDYTIVSEPYTKPGVVVSYNDPQGNHRFITPVDLTDINSDLLPYNNTMLGPLSLEIGTTASFTATGSNTVQFTFDLPDPRPIVGGHLFVEYLKDDGTWEAEQVFTQTWQPGPNMLPVIWTTGMFSETYQPDHDYYILALVTDWQGNIIQTLARPLSSFQTDPKPVFAMNTADQDWNFGTATQGTLLKRTFTFGNVGLLDLLTYVNGVTGLSLSQTGSRVVGPADATTYEMALNTSNVSVGPYDQTVTIRSSDPSQPTQTVRIHGTVTTGASDVTGGSFRPLDVDVNVTGNQSQGTWWTYSHSLGPNC